MFGDEFVTFILIWFKNVSGNGSDLRRSYAWLMEHKRRRILIKINKLLEAADWNLFSDRHVPKNIKLEESATITKSQLDVFRNDFGKTFTDSTTSVNAITNPIERKYRGSESSAISALRNFFDASIISGEVRSIIDQWKFTELIDNPMLPCYRSASSTWIQQRPHVEQP